MKKLFILLAMTTICLVSCSSVPKDVPVEWSPEEINKNAQNYFDNEDYNSAIKLYEIELERYGSDASIQISCEYEIGHIKLRQENYEQARELLTKVVSYYDSGDFSLPPKYKKLAENDLKIIEDILEK